MSSAGGAEAPCASARSATAIPRRVAQAYGGDIKADGCPAEVESAIYSMEAGLPPAPSPRLSLDRLTGSADNLTG
jgi:hypothetical protein